MWINAIICVKDESDFESNEMTLSEYKPKELEAVEELRHRLKGELSQRSWEDTDMFIRFLRARNYDLNAAENMLRNNLNFRKLHRLDTIISWYTPLEVGKKYVSVSPIGNDKEGYPTTYVDFGKLDIPGLLKSGKPADVIAFMLHLFETEIKRCEEQSKKHNRRIDKFVYLINFENLPLSLVTNKPAVEVIAKIITWYEGNYPERLKTAIFFNAPWYFTIGYNLVKPLISGTTIQKLKIFGKNGWREEVLTIMHTEDLPAFLGGSKTDPDGNTMCQSFIVHGSKVPESYYLSSNKESLSTKPDVKKLVINRLSKSLVQLRVLHPGSNLEWEFETKSKDIAFCLFYKENDNSNNQMEQLIPKQRVDASLCSDTGFYKCELSGSYFLEFDNSYSWIHQKEVYYKVQVISPQMQKGLA